MNSITSIVVATMSLAIGVNSVTADWPQFRGPTGQGISSEKGLPLTWSEDKNIAWKVTLPGAGTSSPIVYGDHIFLTCYSGYKMPGKPAGRMEDLKRHVVCLNKKDGKLVWDRTVESKLPEQERIREDHGYATSTPVAEKGRVYASFGKSGVFAFDDSGKKLWHADVGSKLNDWGSATPLALLGDLVLVNASIESESLVAINKNTGKQVWKTPGLRESWHMPNVIDVGGKQEIIIATQGKVFGIDPKSGDKLWNCNTDIGWYMVPTPVSHDGVVYCLGGRSGVAALAIRGGGRGDVTKSHRLWTSTKGSNVTSPIYHDGHLYWMHESLGIAYCAEAKSGKVIYSERIGSEAGVYGSPVMADGRIYYTERNGKTLVVAAEPKFKLLAQNTLGKRITVNASPAISDGRILMRVDQTLYCISEKK